MSLLSNLLIFILKAVLDFLTVLFLLRFYFQIVKIPFQNPVGQMVMALTDFAVKPARRLISSIRGIDVATLLLAILTQLVLAVMILWLQSSFALGGSKLVLATLIMALSSILSLVVMGFIGAVLLYVILSWVHPYSPAMPFLQQFSHPVLRYFKKWIPLIGNIDLSPLVFVLVAQLLLFLVESAEKNLLASLLMMQI